MIAIERSQRRGAALYSLVVSTVMVVTLMGITALSVARLERKKLASADDLRMARNNSISAIELALTVLSSDPSWRSNFSHGVETSPVSIAGDDSGTLSWMIEDSDGSITNADELLTLTGIGRFGSAVQVTTVTVEGKQKVPNSLQCTLHAVEQISQDGSTRSIGGPVSSAELLYVDGYIEGDVEGNPVDTSQGYVSGSKTSPGPERVMPVASVWDDYLVLATEIPYSSFTGVDATHRRMLNELLGLSHNPFGGLSTEGIYLVQIPDGQTLTIENSRIHATLLVRLGAGATFRIDEACVWDPPSSKRYPSLIAKSDSSASIVVDCISNNLVESSVGRNLNPAGDPYDGNSDSDTSDSYPSKLRGLFHVIGSNVLTSLQNSTRGEGVWVTEGNVEFQGDVRLTLDETLYSYPPDGYATGGVEMQLIHGTWLWDEL